MEKTDGLRSMSIRLSKLEKERRQKTDDGSDDTDEDSLSRLVNEIRKKEKITKKQNFKTILEHFDNDLNSSIIFPSEDYFIDIVIFVIKYVEENASRLSSYLAIKNSSEFKRSLATSLVLHRLKKFNNDFVSNSIDSIHKLMYPKAEERFTISKPVEVVKENKRKNFFSK